MSFINYVSNNFPSLDKDLTNSLSKVSRELLDEAASNYGNDLVKDKITKYQELMDNNE